MPKTIGYARSGDEIALETERSRLIEAGATHVHADAVHPDLTKRALPGLAAALAATVQGDTLLVWSYDRLARTPESLFAIFKEAEKRGIRIVSLDGTARFDAALLIRINEAVKRVVRRKR